MWFPSVVYVFVLLTCDVIVHGQIFNPSPPPGFGWYDVSGGTWILCGTGTYGPGNDFCLKCPVGSANDCVGKSKCLVCPAGKGTAVNGSTTCDTCGQGNYSQVNGICVPCPLGTYAPDLGSRFCTSCNAGNYGNRTACTPCPIGTAPVPHSLNTALKVSRLCCMLT